MNNSNPLVSVILPVFNAQNTILDALNSIVAQTYTNIEIIVINDGSSDASEQLIKSINDFRIKYVVNDSNKGLIYTLNRGLQMAKGKYIARMDADDFSLPSRLEKQVEVMEANPDVVVCGCDIELFGNVKSHRCRSTLKMLDSSGLKQLLVKVPCFAHPTVMMRKSVLDSNQIQYDYNYLHAEDYKLWIDLAPLGNFYMIPLPLLKYRISDTQITKASNKKQIDTARRCRKLYISRYIGDSIATNIEKHGVSLSTLKLIKRIESSNKYLLDVLYLSFRHYSFQLVAYYIFSFDCFRLGGTTFLQFMKRVLIGTNSYL